MCSVGDQVGKMEHTRKGNVRVTAWQSRYPAHSADVTDQPLPVALQIDHRNQVFIRFHVSLICIQSDDKTWCSQDGG